MVVKFLSLGYSSYAKLCNISYKIIEIFREVSTKIKIYESL